MLKKLYKLKNLRELKHTSEMKLEKNGPSLLNFYGFAKLLWLCYY